LRNYPSHANSKNALHVGIQWETSAVYSNLKNKLATWLLYEVYAILGTMLEKIQLDSYKIF